MLPFGKNLLDYLEQKAHVFNKIRSEVDVEEWLKNSSQFDIIEKNRKIRRRLQDIDPDIVSSTQTNRTPDGKSIIKKVFFRYERYIMSISGQASYVNCSLSKEIDYVWIDGTPGTRYEPITEVWLPTDVMDILNKKICFFNDSRKHYDKVSIIGLNEIYNLDLPLNYSEWTEEHCTLLRMVSV